MFKRFETAPWSKVFRVLGWFTLSLTLLFWVPTVVSRFPQDGPKEVALNLLVFTAVSLLLAIQALFTFTVLWVGYDLPKGWAAAKKFVREIPENWRRFKAGVRATASFLWRLPGNCLRGLVAAFRWVASAPEFWATRSRHQKLELLFTGGFLSLLGVTMYCVWPLAVSIQEWALAPWQSPVSGFVSTLMTTMIISTMLVAIGAQILFALLRCVIDVFRGSWQ